MRTRVVHTCTRLIMQVMVAVRVGARFSEILFALSEMGGNGAQTGGTDAGLATKLNQSFGNRSEGAATLASRLTSRQFLNTVVLKDRVQSGLASAAVGFGILEGKKGAPGQILFG